MIALEGVSMKTLLPDVRANQVVPLYIQIIDYIPSQDGYYLR